MPALLFTTVLKCSWFNIMYCLVITTCSPQDERAIVDALLSSHLAACVSSFPVTSTYVWKGRAEQDEEIMLLIKTKRERYGDVERKIKEVHPYEVPEILCVELADGHDAYFKWIEEVVG